MVREGTVVPGPPLRQWRWAVHEWGFKVGGSVIWLHQAGRKWVFFCSVVWVAPMNLHDCFWTHEQRVDCIYGTAVERGAQRRIRRLRRPSPTRLTPTQPEASAGGSRIDEPWVSAKRTRAHRCWATSLWSRITPIWCHVWPWLSSSAWCSRYCDRTGEAHEPC